MINTEVYLAGEVELITEVGLMFGFSVEKAQLLDENDMTVYNVIVDCPSKFDADMSLLIADALKVYHRL